MNARERYMVERIDRRREHAGARDRRTSRADHLRNLARLAVEDTVGAFQGPDRVMLLSAMVDAASHALAAADGPVEAASALSKRAYDLCAPVGLQSPRVAAEGLFKGRARP